MQRSFTKFVILAFGIIVTNVAALAQHEASKPVWHEAAVGKATLHYTDADESVANPLAAILKTGDASVRKFFGGSFNSSFGVYIYPDRNALDRQWQQAWGDSGFHSECWMVASGVANRLDVVSPRIWAAEHCEHDFSDSAASRNLLVHELVHVYHGQHNPRKQFDGMDSLSWFVEGLATYASGQLDESHLVQVKQQIESGKAPKSLGGFWSGKARYGNAGSLVAYIDKKYGRKMLSDLMSHTDQQSMLRTMNVTESDLIAAWRASLH